MLPKLNAETFISMSEVLAPLYGKDAEWCKGRNFITMRFVYQCCSRDAKREEWEYMIAHEEELLCAICGGDERPFEERDVMWYHEMCSLWDGAIESSDAYSESRLPVPEGTGWDVKGHFLSLYEELGIAHMLAARTNGVCMEDVIA